MNSVELFDRVLPCMQEYFQGNYNYKTKQCLKNRKCEYLNGLGGFILSEYQDYHIINCCDIECQNVAQPEAILKNFNNETIGLEMKSIPNDLLDTMSKSEKERRKTIRFWEKIIEGCAKNAYLSLYSEIDTLYKRIGINNNSINELLYIIFNGMEVRVYAKNASIQQLFMENKDYQFKLTENMRNFSYQIFKDILNDRTPQLVRKEEFADYSVQLILTQNNSIFFKIYDKGVHNISLNSLFSINENCLIEYLQKFINSCNKKFSNLRGTYKNILLLDHNFIFNEGVEIIEKCLYKCKIPKNISEIWICDKHIEEEYDENGEQIGEHITEITYKKFDYPRFTGGVKHKELI